MQILLILVPLIFLFAAAIFAGFMWALKAGQFEDLEGNGSRIFDDEDQLK
jgi:cbb3-type cytochrome oxidase maturation protein